MKATDLMIGDLVCQKESNLILKVSKVNPPYIEAEGEGGQFHGNTLQAIPLTKEILEKNGFVDMDGGQYRWFLSDDECYYFGFSSICYYTHSNFLNMTKEHQSGNQQQVKGFFEYVHELQHALRLCGIEKEVGL